MSRYDVLDKVARSNIIKCFFSSNTCRRVYPLQFGYFRVRLGLGPGAPEGPKGRGGTPEKRALGHRFRGHSPNLKGTLPLLALQKLIRFVKQFIPRILFELKKKLKKKFFLTDTEYQLDSFGSMICYFVLQNTN